MSKYKIIITLILFCLFQTTPSISLELKIPKDLKELGDALKKEIEKKEKKKSKKNKKKQDKEDEKINYYSTNNNYIYYSDVINDKYFKKIKFFKPEYMGMGPKGGRKVNLTNYSYIVKSPDKNYEVEYIAAIKSEREDAGWTVYSGNFTAINLKNGESKTYKFSSREDSNSFKFLESSLFLEIRDPRATWYQYTGMTCKNEQNPQCMKRLAEVNIIGFRDLKNNLTYAEFVSNYKKKVEERNKKAAEKKIAEEKARIEEENRQAERNRKAEEKRVAEQKIAEEKIAEEKKIANLPKNRLYSAYTFYISIKKFHEASSIYYVSNSQMREAKSQIKVIEKILVEKDSTMNVDSIWTRAANKIDGDLDANTLSIAAASPTAQFQAMAKIFILGLGDVHNKLVGPKSTEKDF